MFVSCGPVVKAVCIHARCVDCPQVQAVTCYEATEPDELLLELSDVVNVFRKVSDDGNPVTVFTLNKKQKLRIYV